MTQSNDREIYEVDFRFRKFQILETEWIHINVGTPCRILSEICIFHILGNEDPTDC